jgi:hypothetical protein
MTFHFDVVTVEIEHAGWRRLKTRGIVEEDPHTTQ